MSKPIRVLIADHDQTFAGHLQRFLNLLEDITVVETTRDGQGAINACRDTLPDLVLIDLHLPVLDSIKTIQAIITQNQHIKILGISSIPNDRYAIEAVKAGACGYVEKNGQASYANIANAIREAANGEVVLTSTLAADILQEFS